MFFRNQILLCIVLIGNFMSGQQPQIQFSYLDTNDGLSQSTINCIYQDKMGFIWVGTEDGLNRYDGVTFKIFKNRTSDSAQGLFSNSIQVIKEDCYGNLLIGTSKGLNFYNREKEEISRFNELPSHKISSLYIDESCNLWIGSQNLYLYDTAKKSLKEYFPNPDDPASISNGIINSIFKDQLSNLWIGTQYGLNLYQRDTDNFAHYFHNPDNDHSLDDNVIRAISQDKNGTFWIGTNKGLNAMIIAGNNPIKTTFFRFSHDPYNTKTIGNGSVLSLLSDASNTLWVGSQNGGLSIVSNPNPRNKSLKFTRYYQNDQKINSINAKTVQTIVEDKHQNIWVGTFGKGLNIFHRDAKQIYHVKNQYGNKNSINNDHINTFFEEDNYIWIGTEGGLNRYDKKTKKYTYFTYDPNDPNSLGSNAVWEIYKDKLGNLWIGTWNGGLNLYDYETETFKRFNMTMDTGGINSDNVFSVYEDSRNNLWIGTMGGGLNRFDRETTTFSNYTIQNSNIKTNYVEDIIETFDGHLIIANNNGALEYDYQKDEFMPLSIMDTKNSDLNVIDVYDIFEDKSHNLWFGTDSGLYLSNADQFRQYSVNDGLPSNSIKAINQDKEGNLWLGTNKGLSKVIINNTSPINVSFKNYAAEDGLQGNEFNRRASWVREDGLLYFGGTNGYNLFYPTDLKKNKHLPEVVFTDFKIFNASVGIGDDNATLQKHINHIDQIVLTHDQSVFSFNYVGLNYISSENNQYAYKMQGFDKTWNYVGVKKEATYTNLNSGDYTFIVKAANNDGVWNPDVKKIKIKILPPFYKTIWAYIIYALLLGAGLMLFRRYSIIAIEEKNNLIIEHLERTQKEEMMQSKLHFFTNLSHEIRTPLTLIDGPVEDLLDSDVIPEAKNQLQLVNRNVKRLKMLINQLLDFRRLETGNEQLELEYHDIIGLVKEVLLAFQQHHKDDQISYKFLHKEAILFCSFDYQKMTTVLYNLLSNAVKYNNSKGSVTISVNKSKEISNDFIEIKVEDTGIGIPEDQLKTIFDRFHKVDHNKTNFQDSSGIGLNIVKEYVTLHKGEILVESVLNKGSCFTIKIPFNNQENERAIKYDKLPQYRDFIQEELQAIEASDYDINHDEVPPLVLIVEDNKDLILYTSSILKSDFRVQYATNGREGLELANEIMPDLIITDIMMPEMNGIELCKILKSTIHTSHIPVIMLTAKTSDENIEEGVINGADVYITKPFNRAILKAYIVNLIGARHKIKEKIKKDLILVPNELEVSTLDEEFLNNLMNIIESNYANSDFDVKQLSTLMNMSYRGLARKIKAITNQTANEFIRTIRLKKAATLLKKGKLPISEISNMVGFNDPAYFSRCFQKEFGIAPKKYG